MILDTNVDVSENNKAYADVFWIRSKFQNDKNKLQCRSKLKICNLLTCSFYGYAIMRDKKNLHYININTNIKVKSFLKMLC